MGYLKIRIEMEAHEDIEEAVSYNKDIDSRVYQQEILFTFDELRRSKGGIRGTLFCVEGEIQHNMEGIISSVLAIDEAFMERSK